MAKRMIHILAICWLAGFCARGAENGGSGSLDVLFDGGPSSNRFSLVILAEGYTASQKSTFLADARQMAQSLFLVQPYQEYQNCFNVYALFVASAQTGSDHPSQNVYRDTIFNSTFDSYGMSSFLTIPPNNYDTNYSHGQGKIDALVTAFLPRADLSLVLVNDLAYGGGGGPVLISSVSSSSPQIVVHESGHTLAGLGDEYGDPFPGFPDVEEPNTTRETNRDQIKWKAWISSDTPVPTPATSEYSQAVGLFEGAHYHFTGWYRPKSNCTMRSLGEPFCEICREALVKAIFRRMFLLDSFLPVSTNLTVGAAQDLTFSVDPVRLATHQLLIQWFTNGVPVPGANGTVLVVSAGELGSGRHSVRAEVTDNTPWVRSDPEEWLRRSVSWSVEVAAGGLRLEPLAQTKPAAGAFSLVIWGTAEERFVLETSTNLVKWESWLTNRLSSGRFMFQESAAAHASARFYRCLSIP